MEKVIVILLSPVWFFLALTDYLDYRNFIFKLKERYNQFKKFTFNSDLGKEK